MKYYYIKNHKIPRFTKGFKALWLILGFVMPVFAVILAYIIYRIRFPRVTTVRKVAMHWALLGLLIYAVIFIIRFFIL